LNQYYDVENSKTVKYLNCKKDQWSWDENDRWAFDQSYGEGSTYRGFWIKEDVYLSNDLHEEDKTQFIVGWVTTETKLFYSQKADGNFKYLINIGIMGLSTSGGLKSKPIYYQLFNQKLIEHLQFALWFGHNGGKFIVGGYDESFQANADETMQWTKLNDGKQFRINLKKFKVGNIVMPNAPSTAFVDSGTTFAYMSKAQK